MAKGMSAVVAGAVLLLAATCYAQGGVQISLDGRTAMVQKDVGVERWAIIHNPEANSVTGNVFFSDGSDPAFVWCEILGQTGSNFNLDCYGSDPCPSAPCTPAEWDPLGPVTLPASFLAPPGGSPLTANPCPSDMVRIGAECIDQELRAPQNLGGAMGTCNALGRSLCDFEAILACDVLEPLKGPGAPLSCGDVTDDAGQTIWTSSTHGDAANPSTVDNLTCYKGSNTIVQCHSPDLNAFFCCQPARQ